jgi:hypothetical protein
MQSAPSLLLEHGARGVVDENRGVRFIATMAIGRATLGALAPVLQAGLLDDSESVRAATIFALRSLGEGVDPSPLASMVQSEDPEVRGNATMVLGMLGNPSAIPLIESSLGQGMRLQNPMRVRITELQAAEALVALGKEEDVEPIRAALFAPVEQGELTVLACDMLGRLGDQQARPMLMRLLLAEGNQRRPPEIRVAAAGALFRLPAPWEPGLEKVLLEQVGAEDPRLRVQVAAALRQVPGEEAGRALDRMSSRIDTSPLHRYKKPVGTACVSPRPATGFVQAQISRFPDLESDVRPVILPRGTVPRSGPAERNPLVHLLTKLFVVLVSLLAVMITPLVAVNAVNEQSFKDKWLSAEQKRNAALEQLDGETQARMAEATAAAVQTKELELRIAQLQKDYDSSIAESRRLQGELADARSGQEDIRARIAMMAQTQQAQQQLGETLVAELRSLRTRAVDAERQSVDLEQELGVVRSQLEVANAARRALQEEVQQLNDEKDQATSEIGQYVALYGELQGARAGSMSGYIPADRNLSANIIGVRRSEDSTLAEINAGSRDGVQEGWVLTIADGSRFMGNLRIIEVDVNRATGIIELEDQDTRGAVRAGQRAIAREGQ